jgi:hypothetical protein
MVCAGGVHGDPHGGTPKVLARDLDDPGLAASHSALSRELRAVLTELRQGVQQQADAGHVGVIVPNGGSDLAHRAPYGGQQHRAESRQVCRPRL